MNNAQKTPFARSFNLAVKRRALEEILKRGGAVPGHVVSIAGQIVTVKFDVEGATFPGNLTLPLATSRYIRHPVQAGDLGVAIPSELYLGGVTGLGGGTADTELIGNLSALVWWPIANKNWSSAGIDPNAVCLQAPNGVVLTDDTNASSVKVTPANVTITAQNSITLVVGGKSIVINASGITIEGREFLAHEHTGVQTGGGVSGGVV